MSKFKRRQTKQQPKADAVLAADIHIRPDTPVCRTDDYWAAQEKKIDFILELREQHDCPLLVAGDLGNKSQWPNWLLEWIIDKFKDHEIICVPGQHDLPNHRIDFWKKSGIGVLYTSDAIYLHREKETIIREKRFRLTTFPYGIEIENSEYIGSTYSAVAMAHQMVIKNKTLWPGQEAPKGHQLLKKFPEYSLILVGDNHHPFVAEYEGRKLVNPGSMMRMVADMENHRPRVYLWYAKSNEVVPVYLPIEQGVITREHIEAAEERSNRYDSFMTRVKEDVEIQLSYEDNMGRYFEKFRTELPVKEKVQGAMV